MPGVRPVRVPLVAVFSLVLRAWSSGAGVLVSTTVSATVAAALVLVPSVEMNVKVSVPW